MSVLKWRYEDIKIGAVYSFERTITEKDEQLFAELTGDSTRLSADTAGSEASGQYVVHGMLSASLFSTLIDIYTLGPKSLYVNQTIQFRKPIFYGDHLKVRGTVLDKSDVLRLVTLRTEIVRGSEVVVSGEAKVKILV